MDGRLESIWIKRAHGGVMDAAERAQAVEGQGLKGDAHFGRGRQVTVIARETFERIRGELPSARPVMRRANLMVSGVALEGSRGRILSVGPVRILVRGETRPCNLMDEQCAGLRAALETGWGGGVHGSVVRGGPLEVGDPVSIEDVPAEDPSPR